MRVGITGATGFLGTALARHLRWHGHEVTRFVRHEPSSPDELSWDGRHLIPDRLRDLDAVVHLAGAGIGDKRWSAAYREKILRSRVEGTNAVARAMAHAGTPVLLSASGAGFYGDTGDELVDETSPGGTGFLADVCREWEAATEPAHKHARVVHLRTAVVLGRGGGALAKQVPLFKAGLGAPLGSGDQWFSWISLADHVAAVRHLLTSEVSGPVNLVAPAPVTNREFTKELGRAVHRPTLPLAVPRTVLRVALGGLVDDILASQRVAPGVLAASGFTWTHPDLASALATAVTKRPPTP